MKNNNTTNNAELPSIGKLIKSTILAIVLATIILVTVVLPAEYGIDPTGVGGLIGLVKMGHIKSSLAEEAATEEALSKAQVITPSETKSVDQPDPQTNQVEEKITTQQDKFSFTLAPDQGKEIKLTMKKGEKLNYLWFTDKNKANFDAHADSKELAIKYHNYEKGKLERSEGKLVAAFDGNHGWFWRNRTSENMTVTLEVSGAYTAVVEY